MGAATASPSSRWRPTRAMRARASVGGRGGLVERRLLAVRPAPSRNDAGARARASTWRAARATLRCSTSSVRLGAHVRCHPGQGWADGVRVRTLRPGGALQAARRRGRCRTTSPTSCRCSCVVAACARGRYARGETPARLRIKESDRHGHHVRSSLRSLGARGRRATRRPRWCTGWGGYAGSRRPRSRGPARLHGALAWRPPASRWPQRWRATRGTTGRSTVCRGATPWQSPTPGFFAGLPRARRGGVGRARDGYRWGVSAAWSDGVHPGGLPGGTRCPGATREGDGHEQCHSTYGHSVRVSDIRPVALAPPSASLSTACPPASHVDLEGRRRVHGAARAGQDGLVARRVKRGRRGRRCSPASIAEGRYLRRAARPADPRTPTPGSKRLLRAPAQRPRPGHADLTSVGALARGAGRGGRRALLGPAHRMRLPRPARCACRSSVAPRRDASAPISRSVAGIDRRGVRPGRARLSSSCLRLPVPNPSPSLDDDAGRAHAARPSPGARRQGDSVGGVVECAALGHACRRGRHLMFDGA